MYHVEFSAEKTREWLRCNAHLIIALFWVALTWVVMAIWGRPLVLLLMMGLYTIVTWSLVVDRLIKDAHEARQVILSLESRERKNEGDVQLLITTLDEHQEEIMAIGNETKAALEELREAIATETDQAAEKIIAHLGADAATADAIREAVEGVKNIIPDDVEDTDVPAVQEPEEGDEGEGDPVDPDDAA